MEDEGVAAMPAADGSAADAPESRPDPELSIEELKREKRLGRENQTLRRARNEAWSLLGVSTLAEFDSLKARVAAGVPLPVAAREPEPEPEVSKLDPRDVRLHSYRLIAEARLFPAGQGEAFRLLEEKIADIRDGVPYDRDGEPITYESLRAIFPRYAPADRDGDRNRGGSGGKMPLPMKVPEPVDPVSRALESQKFYESNRQEILDAERRAHRS